MASRESRSKSIEEHQERLDGHPPSAKYVAKIIELEGSATQATIINKSLLPRRTVGFALERLEDAGVVQSRPSFTDARKTIYELY